MSYYRILFRQPDGKQKLHMFIKHVLKIVDPDEVVNIVERLVKLKENDTTIFKYIANYKNSVSNVTILNNTLDALNLTRNLMVRQTVELLRESNVKLNLNGHISFGDSGRYIESLIKKVSISKPYYIAYDSCTILNEMEAGKMIKEHVMHVKFDYDNVLDIPLLNQSVDIVTCYTGIHHFKITKIALFMKIVHRLLRPNGVFVLRDHDGTFDMIPLLYNAHTTYNAVTDVRLEDELNEFRNFQPLKFIVKYVESFGFRCTNIFKYQPNDPTKNALMCFIKVNNNVITNDVQKEINTISINNKYKRGLDQTYQTAPEWLGVDIAKTFADFMIDKPWYLYPFLSNIKLFWYTTYMSALQVVKNCGVKKIFSEYTIMNVFVGIVLTIIFLVLKLLAIGPLMIYGEMDDTFISVVIVTQINDDDIVKIDDRIKIKKTFDKCKLIELPHYMPFTDIIIKLALSNVEFVEVSTQTKIQVKIKLIGEHVVQFNKNDCNELYRYNILSSSHTEIMLDVNVSSLSQFIRDNHNDNTKVMHIYDY
jgi:hypothetical protein